MITINGEQWNQIKNLHFDLNAVSVSKWDHTADHDQINLETKSLSQASIYGWVQLLNHNWATSPPICVNVWLMQETQQFLICPVMFVVTKKKR